MLEQLGCSVDVVTNGTQAVEHFRNRGNDLILMDWQMPLMDGIEATARIRALPGGLTPPIVGTTSVRAHAECFKAGLIAVATSLDYD